MGIWLFFQIYALVHTQNICLFHEMSGEEDSLVLFESLQQVPDFSPRLWSDQILGVLAQDKSSQIWSLCELASGSMPDVGSSNKTTEKKKISLVDS